LPEFIICALDARLGEASDGATLEERCTLDHLIESELVNLISLRDVAELYGRTRIRDAVQKWLVEVGDQNFRKRLSATSQYARRANDPHKLTKAAGPLARRRSRLGRLRTARTRHVGCSSLLPLRVSRGSRRAAPGAGVVGGFCRLE
jgi:hypothetical protein